jgi:hypothetical protein
VIGKNFTNLFILAQIHPLVSQTKYNLISDCISAGELRKTCIPNNITIKKMSNLPTQIVLSW